MTAFSQRSGRIALCFICTLLLCTMASVHVSAVQRKDLGCRDPFVYYDAQTGKFYLTGTHGNGGYNITETTDPTLETWSEWRPAFRCPQGFWADRAFWAPEISEYKGKYYMIGTGGSLIRPKGIMILVSDSPGGPYALHSPDPLTPPQYECLDGTLYVDKKGDPWLVYSREWRSAHDGQMRAFRLKDDLTGRLPGAQDTLLFSASSAPWSASWGDDKVRNWLTDGPQLLRLSDGKLVMAWSSNTILPQPIVWGYAVGLAYSTSGEITGPWVQEKRPLYNGYAGHGMLFRHPTEGIKLSVLQPQSHAPAYPLFVQVYEVNGKLTLADPKTPDYVLAYWRFEDLTPGRSVLPSIDILDVSANGNHLRATDYNSVGGASADVPAAVVPANGRPNRVSYDSSQAPEAPAETCFLFSPRKSLNDVALKTWTLEASIRPAKLGERQTFLGRDAEDKTSDGALSFALTPDGHIELRLSSRRNEEISLSSTVVAEPGKWCNTAAAYDGREIRLYVDRLDGSGYKLESTVLAKGLTLGKSAWTVGRGMRAGRPAEQFFGLIDEVRISRTALPVKDLLFYAANPKH